MKSIQEDSSILDLGGVADLLGVSVGTVRKLARSNMMPTRRLGNEYRFSKKAVLAWLDPNIEDELVELDRELRLDGVEQLYTLMEVSRRLDVPPHYPYRMVQRGELEAFKLSGRGLRVPESSLLNVMRLLDMAGEAQKLATEVQPPQKDYYLVSEIASALSSTPAYIYRFTESGELPFAMIHSPELSREVVQVKREDLLKWLESKRVS